MSFRLPVVLSIVGLVLFAGCGGGGDGGDPMYPGSGVFSLNAGNTAYSITIQPKRPVTAGNTYGVPSQMGITVPRPGGTDSWWGGLVADIGTVTITTFAADRLVASFSGNLTPLNAAAGLVLSGGAINAYRAQ